MNKTNTPKPFQIDPWQQIAFDAIRLICWCKTSTASLENQRTVAPLVCAHRETQSPAALAY